MKVENFNIYSVCKLEVRGPVISKVNFSRIDTCFSQFRVLGSGDAASPGKVLLLDPVLNAFFLAFWRTVIGTERYDTSLKLITCECGLAHDCGGRRPL